MYPQRIKAINVSMRTTLQPVVMVGTPEKNGKIVMEKTPESSVHAGVMQAGSLRALAHDLT